MITNNTFTVVIPTYNRAHLVGRAIGSVLEQRVESEILVVDDASTDNTTEVVKSLYPEVRYLRQNENLGPGPARTLGLRNATNRWVIMLDDDDTLLPGALELLSASIDLFSNAHVYPVLQFARSNGLLHRPFAIVDLDEYFLGSISGDFVPVIQAQRFFKLGLSFPDSRIGVEHLLWWKVAYLYGIPTWSNVVAQLHSDAPNRLTSVQQQIIYARKHAEAHDMTLTAYGTLLKERAPGRYYKDQLGAVIYWLLAGERNLARTRLKQKDYEFPAFSAMVVLLLSYMPNCLIENLFLLYRRLKH